MTARPILHEFLKFSLVGTLNTLTSTAIYVLCSRGLGLSPLRANAVAFVVAVTVSFILNKHWTFRDPRRSYVRQYSKFFLVGGIGFLLSEAILWIAHSVLGFYDLVAFLMAVAIVLVWNFSANRWWTFRDSSPRR